MARVRERLRVAPRAVAYAREELGRDGAHCAGVVVRLNPLQEHEAIALIVPPKDADWDWDEFALHLVDRGEGYKVEAELDASDFYANGGTRD